MIQTIIDQLRKQIMDGRGSLRVGDLVLGSHLGYPFHAEMCFSWFLFQLLARRILPTIP